MKQGCKVYMNQDVWEEMGLRFGNKRSQQIEDLCINFLNMEDDTERELVNQITEYKQKLEVAETRLCKLREKKHEKQKIDKNYDEPLESLSRFQVANGFVGKNQIKSFAKRHNLSYEVLFDKCVEAGFKIENYGGYNG